MQFKHRIAFYLDRLISTVEQELPGFLKGRLVTDLEAAFLRPLKKNEFMRAVDSFQTAIFEKLAVKYRSEPFAKLVSLKLSNLAVAKYHYLHRHSILTSRPLQLTVDPTNSCQLRCPGCVHSSNAAYALLFDWPRTTLPVHVHDQLLDRIGPFAFSNLLFNYGEPLLHKHFADFVRSSKNYLLFTLTSTNLSMPLSDPDDLVASGLDRMVGGARSTAQRRKPMRAIGGMGISILSMKTFGSSRLPKSGSDRALRIWCGSF